MSDPAGTGPARTDARPTTQRPPLRRDTEAGMIGGVAAGLARHLDVDVVLVRIAFVIGALLTQGLGLLAYILCWIFVPKAEEDSTPAPPRAHAEATSDGRGAPFWVGVGLLTLGALWFLGAMPWPRLFGLGWLDGGVLVPLLLIGLGVALWRTSGRPTSDAATPPVPATSTSTEDNMTSTTQTRPGSEQEQQPTEPRSEEPADAGYPARFDRSSDAQASPPPPPPPPAPAGQQDGFTPPPVPPRPRSLLTRLTLGLTLVTVGILWILEVTTNLALGPLRIVAIALAVVGLGLLVGSVVGRGRPLIIAGVLLLPVVLAGTLLRGLPAGDLVDATFAGNAGFGERIEQVATAEDLASSYSLGAGRFELDLRDLELTEDASTRIEIGAGEVLVIVPADVNIAASASLAGGDMLLFDQRRSGLAFDLDVFDPAPIDDPDTAPTLELHINAGFGDLTVRR